MLDVLSTCVGNRLLVLDVLNTFFFPIPYQPWYLYLVGVLSGCQKDETPMTAAEPDSSTLRLFYPDGEEGVPWQPPPTVPYTRSHVAM